MSWRDLPDARRRIIGHPVVPMKGHAFDFERADTKSARGILSGGRRISGIVFAIPMRDESIQADGEIFLRRGFREEHADQLSRFE